MISITLDIPSGLIGGIALDKSQTDDLRSYLIHGVTLAIAKSWDTQAKKILKSTREFYRRGIIVGEEGRFKGKVMLVGNFPNMIESGVGPFDMKEGLSRGKNRKSKKDGKGWYNTVPFRYSIPGALAESGIFAGNLPQEIYNIVKNKEVKNGSTQPLTAGEIPQQYQIPKTSAASKNLTTNQTFQEYKNKSSLYEGIQRVTKTYSGATQGQYMKFRRVSDKSDPNSFIHPGIVAKKLAEKAVQTTDINKIVDILTNNFINNL